MAQGSTRTLIGAIDVGGTKVSLGVATDAGELIAQERFPTLPERGPEAVIAETIARLLALAGDTPLTRVGVGCVGPLDLHSGVMLSPPNLGDGWHRVPLRAMLEKGLGAAIKLDNDANAAALAEYRSGAGRGADVMAYATISTGIGGGFIIGGRLLHGLAGGAGEFGHQTVAPDGPLCGCGNHGCLEVMASGTAIVNRALHGVAIGLGSGILALAEGDSTRIQASHVAQAAALGDTFAQTLWHEAIEFLAIGLGNVVTTVAPDRLVIGGGVAQAGDLLLEPLKRAIARRVRMLPVQDLDMRLATFGTEVGLHGALALAL